MQSILNQILQQLIKLDEYISPSIYEIASEIEDKLEKLNDQLERSVDFEITITLKPIEPDDENESLVYRPVSLEENKE